MLRRDMTGVGTLVNLATTRFALVTPIRATPARAPVAVHFTPVP
jgi:hypothetical protein